MAKETKSITELERLLSMQKKRVAALQKRKGQLAAQITKIDEELAGLIGEPRAPREVRRGRRRRGGKSLEQFVLEVLGQSPEAKSAAEITEAVIGGGYRTSSKKPVALVRQVLYKNPGIEAKERGKFVLASAPKAPRPGGKKKSTKK